jgi:hypothetical protein
MMFSEKRNIGSYRMRKVFLKTVEQQYIGSSLTTGSFSKLLQKITEYRKLSDSINITHLESKKLIIEKTKTRHLELINKTSWNNSRYSKEIDINNLIERLEIAFEKFSVLRNKRLGRISHGDLCFSNIFWNEVSGKMILIDPRGANNVSDIYIDEYYDLAKLSHSVLGRYDEIINNMYSVKEKSFTFKLNNDEYKKIFIDYLEKNNFSYELVRTYEASLFISMAPLHIDDYKRVYSFLLIADSILCELGI